MVTLASRLRPYFLLIALGFSFLLIQVMSPLDSLDGWLLIVYGVWICTLDQQINPRTAKQQDGPLLPWDEMRIGEKLEYFFMALSSAVLGVLVFVVSTFSSEGIVWQALLAGCVLIAAGMGLGYWGWIHRYGPERNE